MAISGAPKNMDSSSRLMINVTWASKMLVMEAKGPKHTSRTSHPPALMLFFPKPTLHTSQRVNVPGRHKLNYSHGQALSKKHLIIIAKLTWKQDLFRCASILGVFPWNIVWVFSQCNRGHAFGHPLTVHRWLPRIDPKGHIPTYPVHWHITSTLDHSNVSNDFKNDDI